MSRRPPSRSKRAPAQKPSTTNRCQQLRRRPRDLVQPDRALHGHVGQGVGVDLVAGDVFGFSMALLRFAVEKLTASISRWKSGCWGRPGCAGSAKKSLMPVTASRGERPCGTSRAGAG